MPSETGANRVQREIHKAEKQKKKKRKRGKWDYGRKALPPPSKFIDAKKELKQIPKAPTTKKRGKKKKRSFPNWTKG